MIVLKTSRRVSLIALPALLVVLSACVRAPANRAGAGAVTAATATPAASPAATAPSEALPVNINRVAIEVGVGSPIPLTIVLDGSFPNTCSQFGAISQSVDAAGMRIDVQATAQRAGDGNCIDDPLPFRMGIPLNAVALGDGEHTVSVNGVEARFKWPPSQVDRDAPAAKNMRAWLSQVLGVPEDYVIVARMEPATFDDACLGAPRPGEACAQVQTPGYEMTLYVYGEPYAFHTDPEAYRFRLIDRPQPRIGALIATWSGGTDAEVDACGSAEVGTEGVAFGDCGGALLGGRYIDGVRRDALRESYDRYAPFEVETPAGKLRFEGRGEQVATPVEQRMFAEWAKQVFLEARVGRTSATLGSVIGWDRSGEGEGVCEGVSIRITGDATAGRCGETAVTRPLSAGEMEQLYLWVDTYAPFSIGEEPQEKTMTERLVFGGRGSQAADESVQLEILEFARGFAGVIPETP